jgi:hypothetical protein
VMGEVGSSGSERVSGEGVGWGGGERGGNKINSLPPVHTTCTQAEPQGTILPERGHPLSIYSGLYPSASGDLFHGH